MRRDFLKFCGQAGLGLAVPVGWPTLLQGKSKEPDPYEGPYYIVFNASGGWDTTYLMDPKGVNGINRLYKEGDIVTHGKHKFSPTAKQVEKGMSNEDFYKAYGDELLVLNGLDYSVNNHSPCSRYMATGKLDSLAYPTFAALVAACRAPKAPLAFLTFGNYSSTGNLVPMARIPYLPSLKLIANADSIDGIAQNLYHDDFALDLIESTLNEKTEASMGKARLPRAEQAQSMLYAAQSNSKALKRVTPYISKDIPKQRLSQQAEIALSCFKGGVCVSANISIGQFDSHANNDPDQMKLIPEFLAGIDYLVKRSEELKIRDKLVIVIQSEMGRTPHYNKGNGKDHWSIGSIMFMGNGIRGNRVVGATDEKQFLVPIAPKSLSIDEEKGIRTRPEHIHRALRELAGIENHPFSKKFPMKIPEGERLQGLFA
ncbi:MAG: DUF1501 domain-containing protein [Verrucomicrobia bacterium]|nr:DUF1501 domain-containing protein [Verrucomicrobiota bacterium]MDA1048494.1 DUF1501 domain-containing protein [Verrucomicrobiota bacterium]